MNPMTEPIVECPSRWLHHSGKTYTLMAVGNRKAKKPGWGLTAVYMDDDGEVWCRPLDEFTEACQKIESEKRVSGCWQWIGSPDPENDGGTLRLELGGGAVSVDLAHSRDAFMLTAALNQERKMLKGDERNRVCALLALKMEEIKWKSD